MLLRKLVITVLFLFLSACGGSEDTITIPGGNQITTDTTPPSITEFKDFDSGSGTGLSQYLEVIYDEDIDPLSPSPTIQPTVAGTWTVVRGNALQFNLDSNALYQPSTQYVVYIPAGIKDLTGNATTVQRDYAFYTEAGSSSSDTTPPTITSTSPADNATDVAITTGIQLTFSEPINTPALWSGYVMILDNQMNTVPTTANYDMASNILTLTPQSPLSNGTMHTISVQGLGGAVADSAGNYFTYLWDTSFTTIAGQVVTPLAITSHVPAQYSSDISVDTTAITVTFDQDIDQTTLASNTFYVAPKVTQNDSNTALTGTITYDSSTMTATLTLDPSQLTYGTTYAMVLRSSIATSLGGTLPNSYYGDFVTSLQANTPPTASDFSYNFDFDLATDVNWQTLSSAADYDSDSLTATIQTDGINGSFTVSGATLTYTPNSGATSDSGIITINDSNGGTVNANVTVTSRTWQSISNGGFNVFGIKTDGTLWAWGSNPFGELGQGVDSVNVTTPIQIGTDTDWAVVAAGMSHGLALKDDHTLWSWGHNLFGQLGDGTITVMEADGTTYNTNNDSYTPQQVGSSSWYKIAAGSYSSFAFDISGNLYAWGRNEDGQLGIGSNIDASVPTQVGASSGWTAVSSGPDTSSAQAHSLGIMGGNLYVWGGNDHSQLGDNSTTSTNTPTQLGTASWNKVSAGEGFSVAIKDDNTLWTWGDDIAGQLANGTGHVDATAPVQIGSDTWSAISAAQRFVLALQSDNSLWSWGTNFYGQIGDGTRTIMTLNTSTSQYEVTDDQQKDAPVQIGTDTDWSSVSAGAQLSQALKSNGVRYGWGRNDGGYTGTGLTDEYVLTPTTR